MRKNYLLTLFIISWLTSSLATGKGHTVVLNGNVEDSTIKNVDIVSFSPFWRDIKAPRKDVAGARKDAFNQMQLRFKVEQHTFMYFSIFYNTVRLYVQPGDSLSFTVKRKNGRSEIEFTGRNAAYYNYDIGVQAITPKAIPTFNPDDSASIQNYLQEADRRYQLQTDNLNKIAECENLSKEFVKYARNQIESYYVFLIYKPIADGKVAKKALPTSYFSRSNSFKIEDSSLPYFNEYRTSALTYKTILCHTEDPYNNLDVVYNHVTKNFKGKTRDFLVANLVGVYVKKELQSYRPTLAKIMQEAPKFVQDSASLDYIRRCEQDYLFIGKPFPEKVLSATSLKSFSDGKPTSLDDVLKQYQGQAVYIDLWASWCSPCREDIANSAEAKQFLKSKGVQVIYFSFDTKANEAKWLNASKKDLITQDQYLVASDFKSELASYMNLRSIPRYLLLNREHKISAIDAPRPTPDGLPKLKEAVSEALKQVVRF